MKYLCTGRSVNSNYVIPDIDNLLASVCSLGRHPPFCVCFMCAWELSVLEFHDAALFWLLPHAFCEAYVGSNPFTVYIVSSNTCSGLYFA